jgi:predicted phage replisome organizer
MNDSKIKQIRKMPAGNDMVVLWIGLLCLGMRSGRSGIVEIGDDIPYDVDMLSVEFDIEKRTVELALNIFQKFNMIEVFDNGSILLCNFEKHQELSKIEKAKEAQRERTRRFRDNKRAKALPEPKNQGVKPNVTVTPALRNDVVIKCNGTDIDVDTDKNLDKKKNKKDAFAESPFFDWKKDFSVYQQYIKDGFSSAMSDDYKSSLSDDHPTLDVLATVRKAYEYWKSEDGWDKKRSGRSKQIDFKKTIRAILRQEFNHVLKNKPKYKQQSMFDNQDYERPEQRILNDR